MAADLARVARILIAIFLALAAVSFRPLNALTAFAPIPQIVFAVLFIAMIFARPVLLRLMQPFLNLSDRTFLRLSIMIAFGLLAYLNVFILDRVPHVTDSTSYLFMAKTFAKGWLIHPAPIVPEFFLPHFYYIKDGGMIPVFQPGWPIILAIGVLLGIPFLINPLLGSLTLWPIYRIVNRGFGKAAARLTIVLFLLTPFFGFMNASFMAHTLTGLLSLLALDQALLYADDGMQKRVPLIGLMVGFLFVVRAYNAILILIPLAIILLPAFRKKPTSVGIVALAALIALAAASLQLGYNHATTGDAFTFPQDGYFAATERHPHCHRLGFGADIGCESEHGQFGFPDGYYFKDSLSVTAQRIRSLSLNLFGQPIALWLILLLLAAGPLRKEGIALATLAGSLIVGYMLFYYHGNCYGPRFYFEAAPAIMALMAIGMLRLDGWLEAVSNRLPATRRLLKAFIPALALALVIFAIFELYPRLSITYANFRGIDGRMRAILADAKLPAGSLILMPGTSVNYAYGFNLNDAGFNGDYVFVRHLFDGSHQLQLAYPDHPLYRFNPHRNRFYRIRPPKSRGVIFSELETKIPLVSFSNGYAYHQGIEHHRPDIMEAGQLYLDGEAIGATMTFSQYIFEPGDYRIEIEAMRGPYLADWQLLVNGKVVGPTFNGFARDYGFQRWISDIPIHLDKGTATFTVRITGRDEKALDFGAGLDNLTLRRIPEDLNTPLPKLEDESWVDVGGKHIPVELGVPEILKYD